MNKPAYIVGNNFHEDKFRITFSNIPTIEKDSELEYFDRYVRSVTIPEYQVDFDNTQYMGYSINNPVAHKINTDLQRLDIEFRLSEYLKNYTYLRSWIYNIRSGAADVDKIREYYTRAITVSLLDNEKRTLGNITISNSFCASISPIPLIFGTANEISFTASFVYETIDFNYNQISNLVNG